MPLTRHPMLDFHYQNRMESQPKAVDSSSAALLAFDLALEQIPIDKGIEGRITIANNDHDMMIFKFSQILF
jgi:hypothetical protein